MPVNDIPGTNNMVLQATIGAFADEAYTSAKKLSGTGIVGKIQGIDPNTETFVGQVRWNKPITATIHVASLTDPTNGTTDDYTTDFLNYVKTVRTHGSGKVNMAQVVTQVDGLAKMGRDFAEFRAQDEHDAMLAVLKGVAISELLNGAAVGSGAAGLGGQTFDNDPTDKKYGFYVDMGAVKPVVTATAAVQGAARAEAFLQAIGMAWKDYEPDYAYLVTSPEVMASLRSANLVDEDGVQEANIMFNTIFGGKFRLIQTRASQSLSAAQLSKLNTGGGVDIAGTKTSFIVLPGSLAMEQLSVPDTTEIFRDARSHNGGGKTEVWHRWGYVAHPQGYNWAGAQTAFPSNANYMQVIESAVQKDLTAATDILAATSGVWQRKSSSALSLGILPIFHN